MAFLDQLRSLRMGQQPLGAPQTSAPQQLDPRFGTQGFGYPGRDARMAELTAGLPSGAPSALGGAASAIGGGLQQYGQEMAQQHRADMAMHQGLAQRQMGMGRPQQNPMMQVGQLPQQAQQAQSRFGGLFGGARRGGMGRGY